MVEFTLAGIPIIFLIISTVELSRGMWNYHTLASAVRHGARYVAVRGQRAIKNCAGSNCSATVKGIANAVINAGTGLPRDEVTLTLKTASGVVKTCRLSDCLNDSTAWPPPGAAAMKDNQPGREFTVSAQYEFRSAMGFFWPGAGGSQTGTVSLAASSRQQIIF